MSGEVCDREHRGHALINYPDAVRQMVGAAKPIIDPGQSLELPDLLGRILDQTVEFDRDEPPVPRSAMDGFALRSADGVEPRQVLSAIFAGTKDVPEIAAGQACPVMTGGTVPPGADCVIPVEHTSIKDGKLHVEIAPQAGRHVRRAGEMGAAGRIILKAGQYLGAGDLAAAAGCGYQELAVKAQVTASVISTGDEVIAWTKTPKAHQVRDSNRLGSVMQLQKAGAQVNSHLHVPDQPEQLRAAVEDALSNNHLLVTIGGVSMGQKDYMPSVFEELGVDCLFHGVSIQPGKPVWVGQRDNHWVLGLPGNPVSSAVILELFAQPLIATLAGHCQVDAPRKLSVGKLVGQAKAKKRERFLPASCQLDDHGVACLRPRPESGSGDWSSLAGCNALIRLAPNTALKTGDAVDWLSFAN